MERARRPLARSRLPENTQDRGSAEVRPGSLGADRLAGFFFLFFFFLVITSVRYPGKSPSPSYSRNAQVLSGSSFLKLSPKGLE